MNFADKSILNALAHSFGTVLLFISSIIFVRFFSKTDYGTFLQIMLIVNTTITFTFLGIPESVYYFYQREERRDFFLIQTIVISVAIAACASLLVYRLQDEIIRLLNNTGMTGYFGLIALLILLRGPTSLRDSILWSHGSFVLNAILCIVSALINYIVPITGAFLGLSLFQIIKLMVIAVALDAVIHLGVYIWVISDSRTEAINIEEAKKKHYAARFLSCIGRQLRYSLPIGMSSHIGIIGRELDKYIISHWFSPGDFAVYSRGAIQIPVLSTLHFMLNDMMMPKFIQFFKNNDVKSLLGAWHNIIEKVAKINFALACLFFALAPSLIRIVYTEKYIGAVPVFRVYLLLLVLGVGVYGMIARVSGRTNLILGAAVLNLPINFCLSIILLNHIGTIGPAIATVISSLITGQWLLIKSCKVLSIGFNRIFPWSQLMRILLISVAAAVPVYLLDMFNDFSGILGIVYLGVDTICFWFIYLNLLNVIGLFLDEEAETIKKWIKIDLRRFLIADRVGRGY